MLKYYFFSCLAITVPKINLAPLIFKTLAHSFMVEIGPNKSQYRKFRIKTVDGADDVGAMREVLMRRLENNWPLPNLILLDGGAGHLNMARQILKNYKLEIPLLAVAKGPTRKKLDLRSFGSVPEISEILIEQIRNEAHRFAIGYHRKLRGKEFLEGA